MKFWILLMVFVFSFFNIQLVQAATPAGNATADAQKVQLLEEGDEEEGEADERPFTADFNNGDCLWANRYYEFEQGHPYFVIEPGWQIVMEGVEDDEFIRVEITVLDEIEIVDGVATRVVEEREFKDGELFEVAHNWFAICRMTNDIYYFGEDVDFYEDGVIVDHHGAWRAGVDGASPGIFLPGSPLAGSRYFQEVAPGVAEDRAEIMGFTDLEIDGELFKRALVLKESSPLSDPGDFSIKHFARGIGNIADEELEIVEAGFIFRAPPHYPYKK